MPTKTTTITSLRGLNRALNRLPKECTDKLTDASGRIAARVAVEATGKARSIGGVAELVAPTIKASKGKTPAISMGGTRQIKRTRQGRTPRGLKVDVDAGALNRKNQTIGNVMWGAEFGSHRFTQFKPPVKPGYFLWATIEANKDESLTEYAEALDDALKAI